VTNITGRACDVSSLARLATALPPAHAPTFAWQRVPRVRGEAPEEQLVVGLPGTADVAAGAGVAEAETALRRELTRRTAAAHDADADDADASAHRGIEALPPSWRVGFDLEGVPQVAPAALPPRPSALALAAANAASAANAAAAVAAAAAAAAAAATAAPPCLDASLRRAFGGVGGAAGGVSSTALANVAARESGAAAAAAHAQLRARARLLSALPPIFDALRSWQVATGRAAAPERALLDLLHGGGGAAGVRLGSGGGAPVSREEVSAALAALCDVAPHWARREAVAVGGNGGGEGGISGAAGGGGAFVYRFSRGEAPRDVRAHLAAAAREAAAAARAGAPGGGMMGMGEGGSSGAPPAR
jgi:hypothetical protein